MEEGSQFKSVTETIQIDLVNSIAQTVKQKIIDEVNAADFFALQVQEVKNSRMCRQIAVSLRYVKDAKLLERFLGLYEVPLNKKAEELVPVLEKELENFNYKEKLVAQSYDGGVVKGTELYNLQQSIKTLQGNRARCLLVHCYAYELSTILSQSLRVFHDCKLFFSVIDLFSNFFRNIALIDVLPNVQSTWTNSVFSCIKTIHQHNLSLIQVLEFINTAEEYQNSSKVLYDSINLISHLKSFKFMLFVHIFHTIFSQVEEMMDVLQLKPYNTCSSRKNVNTLIDKLRQMKHESVFRALLSSVPSISTQQVIVSGMLDLYTQILDSIIYDIEGRFLDIELTEFCSLVSLDMIRNESEAKRVPDNSYFQSVKENYSSIFDVVKLKSELDLLYSDSSIIGVGDDISLSRITDILKFMYDHEINTYLPMLYKLMTLVVTISSIAEPLENQESVLNRIKEYFKIERTEDPKGAFALLVIEKELFCNLEKSQKWYDQIITLFSNLPSTSNIELTYKNTEAEDFNEEKYEILHSELDIKTEPEFS